jgi:hypothetical protein
MSRPRQRAGKPPFTSGFEQPQRRHSPAGSPLRSAQGFRRPRRSRCLAKNARNGPNHEITPVFIHFTRMWAYFRNCSGLSDLRALGVAQIGGKSSLEWGAGWPPAVSYSRPTFTSSRHLDFEMSSSEFHLAQNTHCQVSTRVLCKTNVCRDRSGQASTCM